MLSLLLMMHFPSSWFMIYDAKSCGWQHLPSCGNCWGSGPTNWRWLAFPEVSGWTEKRRRTLVYYYVDFMIFGSDNLIFGSDLIWFVALWVGCYCHMLFFECTTISLQTTCQLASFFRWGAAILGTIQDGGFPRFQPWDPSSCCKSKCPRSPRWTPE